MEKRVGISTGKSVIPDVPESDLLEMKGKIIQIVTAPNDVYTVHDLDGVECLLKVVCLALTDRGEIIPMDINGRGVVSIAGSTENFKGLKWK
jgi:hypothetical protein